MMTTIITPTTTQATASASHKHRRSRNGGRIGGLQPHASRLLCVAFQHEEAARLAELRLSQWSRRDWRECVGALAWDRCWEAAGALLPTH